MMMGLGCMWLLTSLVTGLERVTAISRQESGRLPGSAYNISTNDKGVHKAVLVGTYSFNNQSNDAFLFKPSAIDDAQRQIIKGIRYIVNVEISRTVCRKKEHEDLPNCAFQPDGLLQQTFKCHFDIWDIPWLHVMKTTFFICHP